MYAHPVVSWPLVFSAAASGLQQDRCDRREAVAAPVSRTPHFALNIMRVLAWRLRAQNSVM
jgi:hypothetical protein